MPSGPRRKTPATPAPKQPIRRPADGEIAAAPAGLTRPLPSTPTELARQADARAASEDWLGAIRLWLEVRRHRPADPRAALGLARACGAIGNRPLAVRLLEEHLSRHPDDAAAWAQLADQRSGPTERHAALAALAEAARLDPGRADVLLRMARLCWAMGNGDLARRRVRECLHIAPRNAEAHYLLGLIYEKWGRLSDALAELRLARELESDADDLATRINALSESVATARQNLARLTQETAAGPGEAKTLYNLATFHVQVGDLSAALDVCNRVLAGASRSADFLELRAKILVEDDRPDEGLIAAEEAADAAGDRSISAVYRRRVENRFGSPAERLGFYRQLLHRQPDRPESRLNLGLLQASLPSSPAAPSDPSGQPTTDLSESPLRGEPPTTGTEAALASFADGLRHSPDHVGLLLARGETLLSAGRLGEALETLQALVAEHPREARLVNRVGLVHLARGDWSAARASFRKSLELQPSSDRTHYYLGLTAELAGDLDDAVAEYRRAVRLNRRYEDARLSLAAVLRWQGRTEEAEEAVRQLLHERPDCPLALGLLAGLTAARGQRHQAGQLYRAALRLPWPERPLTRRLAVHRRGRLLIEFARFLSLGELGSDAVEEIGHLLSAALADTPVEPDWQETAGEIQLRLGRPGEAAGHLRTLLTWEPLRASARLLLVEALLARGAGGGSRADTAKQARGDVKQARGDVKPARGEAKRARGDGVSAALREATRLTETHPQLAPAWSRLGQVQQRFGDPAAAAVAYKTALQLDPRDPDAVTGLLALTQSGVLATPLPLDELNALKLRSLALAGSETALADRLSELLAKPGDPAKPSLAKPSLAKPSLAKPSLAKSNARPSKKASPPTETPVPKPARPTERRASGRSRSGG